MRISVVGCGYLGAVHSTAMASLGHEVVGLDVDEERVRSSHPVALRSTSRGSKTCSLTRSRPGG